MMKVEKVSPKDKEAVVTVVDIHLQTFEGFFLTFMGRGFLTQLYRAYSEHPQSGLLVAREESGEIAGFLAYSADLSDLYKTMIKKRLIPFAWYSLGAFLRKPGVFMRLVRAFLKPGESKRQEAYVELASLGVRPDKKSQGIGGKLVDALKAEVDFSRYAYIALETDARDNEGANRFYQKNGFRLARSYLSNKTREMNEYRYRDEV